MDAHASSLVPAITFFLFFLTSMGFSLFILFSRDLRNLQKVSIDQKLVGPLLAVASLYRCGENIAFYFYTDSETNSEYFLVQLVGFFLFQAAILLIVMGLLRTQNISVDNSISLPRTLREIRRYLRNFAVAITVLGILSIIIVAFIYVSDNLKYNAIAAVSSALSSLVLAVIVYRIVAVRAATQERAAATERWLRQCIACVAVALAAFLLRAILHIFEARIGSLQRILPLVTGVVCEVVPGLVLMFMTLKIVRVGINSSLRSSLLTSFKR